MIRHEIAVGDEVRTDVGDKGKVAVIRRDDDGIVVAEIDLGDGVNFLVHPVDGLARVHPRTSHDWSDPELAQLWIDTPTSRKAIKAVTFARLVLAGRPQATEA